MNTRQNPHGANEVLSPRRVKETLAEIAGLDLVAILLSVILLSKFGTDFAHLPEAARVLGPEVLERILQAFTICISVMLGFYVYLIGRQFLSSTGPATAKTQRQLGFAAEVIASSLTPALLLVVVACVEKSARWGSMFVLIPVVGVMYFLAINLGGFIVFEPNLRLNLANTSASWAAKRLSELRNRSKYPFWQIFLANVLVGGLLGTVVAWFIWGTTIYLVPLFFAFAVCTAVLLAFSSLGIHKYCVSSSRVRIIQLWSFPALWIAVSAAMTYDLFAGSHLEGDALVAKTPILAILIFCTISALWSPAWSWKFARNWSIRGGATRLAAKSVVGTLQKARKEIRDLTAAISEPKEPYLPAEGEHSGVRAGQQRQVPAPKESALEPQS